MGNEATRLIEKWFADHADDGEFAYTARAAAYTVIGPSAPAGRIVIATKPGPVGSAIHESVDSASLGMIGRYGLPGDADIHWIRKVVANHQLFFLGDMDPADLMIFCWLRARLRPKRVVHLGVSDSYLTELQVQLPESFILRCSPSEQKSHPLLDKVFPDLRATVGPKCARLLKRGLKIELEAVVSAAWERLADPATRTWAEWLRRQEAVTVATRLGSAIARQHHLGRRGASHRAINKRPANARTFDKRAAERRRCCRHGIPVGQVIPRHCLQRCRRDGFARPSVARQQRRVTGQQLAHDVVDSAERTAALCRRQTGAPFRCRGLASCDHVRRLTRKARRKQAAETRLTVILATSVQMSII